MFKEATLYRIEGLTTLAELSEAIAREPFQPTAATQQKSSGWEPPRAAHGALIEAVGGQWIARFATETRAVPADAVQAKADEMAAAIERETGRPPGRRERADLKAEALQALLPQAFPRQTSVPVWIDPRAGLLVIGTASQGKADAILTAIVRAVPNPQDLRITAITTATSPQSAMAGWLADPQTLPDCLALGRECELRGCGEQSPVIRFNRCNLDADEVRQRVAEGLLPERLALGWQGVGAFVLTRTLQLRKIEIACSTDPSAEPADAFDADVALATGTLAPCIADLIDALGGIAAEQDTADPVTIDATTTADAIEDAIDGMAATSPF